MQTEVAEDYPISGGNDHPIERVGEYDERRSSTRTGDRLIDKRQITKVRRGGTTAEGEETVADIQFSRPINGESPG